MSYFNLFTLGADVVALIVMLFLQFTGQPRFLVAGLGIWAITFGVDWYFPDTLLSITPKLIYLVLTFVALKAWMDWKHSQSRLMRDNALREMQNIEQRVRELLTMPTGELEEATHETIPLSTSD